MPLLGILAILYAGVLVLFAVKKPEKLWNISKMRIIRKLFGEQGTVIFLYVLSVIFAGLGVWLLTK